MSGNLRPQTPERILICIDSDATLFTDGGNSRGSITYRTSAQALRHALAQFMAVKGNMNPRTEFSLACISSTFLLMQSLTTKSSEILEAFDSCMMVSNFNSAPYEIDYSEMINEFMLQGPQNTRSEDEPTHVSRLVWIYVRSIIPRKLDQAIPISVPPHCFLDIHYVHPDITSFQLDRKTAFNAIFDGLKKACEKFPNSLCIESVHISNGFFRCFMMLLAHPCQRNPRSILKSLGI